MSTIDLKITVRLTFDGNPPEQEVLFDMAEAALRRDMSAGEFSGGLPVKEATLWRLSVKKVEA